MHRDPRVYQLVQELQCRGALVGCRGEIVVGLVSEVVEDESCIGIRLAGDAKGLCDIRGPYRLVPGHIGPQPGAIKHFVGDAPGRDPSAIPPDNARDRLEDEISGRLRVHSPQVIVGPTLTEALVPDQMSAKHQHSLLFREPDDHVGVSEIEVRLRRGTQPVPKQVVFGKENCRLAGKELPVGRIGKLPGGGRRTINDSALKRPLPQRRPSTFCDFERRAIETPRRRPLRTV